MTDMLSLAAELAELSGWRAQAPQSEANALPSESRGPPPCAQTFNNKGGSVSVGYERAQTPETPKLCVSCGEPAHRFGPGDPEHDYDPTACVNSLLWRRDRLRRALFALSIAIEGAWDCGTWPQHLLDANNEARRLTDNLGDLP